MPGEKEKKREGGWSDLLKKEDWLAVGLGFLILALILLGVQVKLPGFKWTTDGELTSRAMIFVVHALTYFDPRQVERIHPGRRGQSG